MPSWKTVQSRKNKAKKTKLALIVLGIVVLLIVFAQIVRLAQTLFSPWNLAKSERNFSWNGQFNVNLVMRGEQISLVSYNPKEQRIVVIALPDETYLEVPSGFGLWQLRSVYGLGSSPKEGSKLLKGSLGNFFGIPIDGFIDVGSLDGLLSKNPFSLFSLLPKLKTDMTLWELIRLKISLSSVRFDKINELDLVKIGILDETALPDGTLIHTADSVALDSVLSDLHDPNFVSEQKSVAIFNATDHPQLAQKAARVISNLGGHVIITSNAKARLEKTQALGEQSATLKRIRQIFGSGDTIEGLDEDLSSSRAQINLFLGEDYFQTN